MSIKNLNNVLYITAGYPRAKDPSNCPFIGYNLAFLRKNGIGVDILHLNRMTFKNANSFKGKLLYLYTLFLPLYIQGRYKFIGEEYKIHKIYYSSFTRVWMLLIVFLLKQRNKYQIFHYHFLWFTQELTLFKKYLKVSSIISIRGSDMHETAVKDRFERDMFKKAIKNADKIIYVSNGLREIAKKIGLATDKDIVIYNGFDPAVFSLTHKKGGNPTFGFVGHLYKVKRADKLPEIFNEIKKIQHGVKLIIVGGGEPKGDLKRKMKKSFERYNLLKDVEFVGEVKPVDVKNYYAKMDILLLPSRSEGFGAVIVEARACGVAVVGTDVSGIPEAIGSAGKVVAEGKFFEKRFAEASVDLLRDLPSRKSVNKDVQSLSWNNIVSKEIKVYKDLLKK